MADVWQGCGEVGQQTNQQSDARHVHTQLRDVWRAAAAAADDDGDDDGERACVVLCSSSRVVVVGCRS